MVKVHIGKKIKEVFKQSGLKGTEFAKLINVDRQGIYAIFKRETMNTGQLKTISKVLDHDFFRYYNNDLVQVAKDEKISFIRKNEVLKELSDELKACRKQLADLEKRNETLEKLNKLLEEKLDGKAKHKK